MRLRLRQVPLTLEEAEDLLPRRVAGMLGVREHRIAGLEVVRRSIDARKKSCILQVFSVEFDLVGETISAARIRRMKGLEAVVGPVFPPPPSCRTPHSVLVVGMGPAGLFAALRLARSGCRVTLVERGRPVEQRVHNVHRFWNDGQLDPESNVQFGEGGAGTFSDGKLTTRLNHPGMRLVLETLVDMGAARDILTAAKPHVGTDRLRLVLINFRQRLRDLGVELRFGSRLCGLILRQGRVCGGRLAGGEELGCDSLVLAPGHSARETYEMLAAEGVAMTSKPFAVGLRVEHPATLINRIQYGLARHPRLPTADYALTYNDPETGRGIYSFCMCPGGEVIIASSEPGGVVVNGMSFRRRNAELSNSALVVSVRSEDLPGGDPLAGVRFQRHWEQAAFRLGGGDYRAPAQNLLAFAGLGQGPVSSSCRPGVREADLAEALPGFVCECLRRALPHFEQRMRGFMTAEATLVGIETRTSSPLRILRDPGGESVSHPGLFPTGEGAGYAGGIMSAALDGLRAAEAIVQRVNDRSPS